MLDSLLGQLNSERLYSLSEYLGESTEKVYSASRGYFATLLGSLLGKSNDLALESTLKQSSGFYKETESAEDRIFSGNLTEGERGNAKKIIQSVFGERLTVLQTRLASATGISSESSAKLMPILTAAFNGYVGHKMRSEDLSLRDLTGKIYDERNNIHSSLPTGFSSLFGLGALTAVSGIPFHEGVNLHYLDESKKITPKQDEAKSKSRSWIGWLFLLICLLLLAYFIRSCKTCNNNKSIASMDDTTNASMSGSSSSSSSTTTTTTTATSDGATITAAPVSMSHDPIKVMLPSGKMLNAYKGGIEEQMVEFLKSGQLDKMSDEDLKKKWFNFDNINYEFGSTNKITAQSQVQVDNIVAILKEFKNTKIKLGAYTDKKGDEAANLAMSQARADDMKGRLEKAGVGSQVAAAEGYGEQFATIDESKSDDERAADRKIALRFVK